MSDDAARQQAEDHYYAALDLYAEGEHEQAIAEYPGKIAKLFATHPAPPDRRASAIALAARFHERDEYIISTSEFQRVKNRLLRLSNARASSAGAIAGNDDGSTPGRPTLKRRNPTPDDSTTTTPDGTPKQDPNKPAPPTLRRDPNAQPQPSPTPQL